MFNGGPIILTPREYAAYRWQDGSQESSLQVQEPGGYWVEATDEYGCTGRDSVLIQERCPTEWFFPNAFSPNDDGYNDVFQAQGIDFVQYSLRIFNRWGEQVFESSDPTIGWDGTNRKGQLVPEGVYVWMLNAIGQDFYVPTYEIRQAGTVTLIR